MEMIKFISDKYGGGSRANLGHDFILSVNSPLVKGEGYSGYVLGRKVGEFKGPSSAQAKCVDVAIAIIKDLNKRFVVEKEGEQ